MFSMVIWNRIKRALFILMSIVLFYSSEISSQINNFKYYSIEDGMPVSTVLTMMQDSRGYLWLGT